MVTGGRMARRDAREQATKIPLRRSGSNQVAVEFPMLPSLASHCLLLYHTRRQQLSRTWNDILLI